VFKNELARGNLLGSLPRGFGRGVADADYLTIGHCNPLAGVLADQLRTVFR